MGSIYKITNTVNGKFYIGKTTHDAVKTRIRDHLTGNSKGSRLIKDDIEKCGQDAFTYEILHDGIIPEFLDTLEIDAIAKFNTIAPHGYNRNKGGSGSIKHSEETRRKMSKAKKGKPPPNKGKTHSKEHRRKISEAMKGKTPSEETRRKISENNAAKRPEVRRKMSEAQKGKTPWNKGKTSSEETRRKISAARETPERLAAREFFVSLPADMPLPEKRNILRQRFSDTPSPTIHRWCQKFESERLTALLL